jgi:hypothetical protein
MVVYVVFMVTRIAYVHFELVFVVIAVEAYTLGYFRGNARER